MTDDSELLCRYANDRSEDAFAELVRRHVDLVYSSALRQTWGDHHRAKEVTQMVFIHLARKAASLVSHPVLPAWLHRSSHLAALDLLRREGRRQKYERAAGAAAAGEPHGGTPVVWEEVRPVLDDAIDGLDERDRQAILLRYFANRPFGEVGEKLKLSENAARMRVQRALEKLQSILVKRGITSTSAALATALSAHAIAAAPGGVALASTSAALAVSGGAGIAWVAFMSTAKFPIALTAAVLVGGATIIGLQNQSAARASAEASGLFTQNKEIPGIRAQNRALALAAEQAGELQDDDANIRLLQARVAGMESKEKTGRAYAAAHRKPSRALADEGDSEPQSEKFHQQPRVLSQTRPEYPADMLNAGIGGEVLVDLVVDKDGAVQNAHALSSSDSAFEAAAVKAVSQWAFQPGSANGHAVFSHMQIPVVFTPTAGAPAPPTAATWF
jgi:RNA polymerase sigma factor (sigma-70 family)